MKRKTKATSEPSLRAKLSANFLAALESDFQENSVAVIKQLREQDLGRYAELVAKMIATTDPTTPDDLSQAKTSADVARIQLQGIGLTDPSDSQIEQAMAAVSRFMTELEMIAALDVSTEMLEERELRQ